ncbi:MAG: NnrS family protein [Pseudomonadota bacterium]
MAKMAKRGDNPNDDPCREGLIGSGAFMAGRENSNVERELIATLIIRVMNRVALGHTGRPLSLPPFAIFIYYTITLAAISRILTALELLNLS